MLILLERTLTWSFMKNYHGKWYYYGWMLWGVIDNRWVESLSFLSLVEEEFVWGGILCLAVVVVADYWETLLFVCLFIGLLGDLDLVRTNFSILWLVYRLLLSFLHLSFLFISFEFEHRTFDITRMFITKLFSILVVIIGFESHVGAKSSRQASIDLFSLIVNIKSKLSLILSLRHLLLPLLYPRFSLPLSFLLFPLNSFLLFHCPSFPIFDLSQPTLFLLLHSSFIFLYHPHSSLLFLSNSP